MSLFSFHGLQKFLHPAYEEGNYEDGSDQHGTIWTTSWVLVPHPWILTRPLSTRGSPAKSRHESETGVQRH